MSADPATDLMERLGTGVGARLLASLPPYDEASSLALMTRLRDEGHDADLVAAALTQSRLRARGRARLGVAVDDLLARAGVRHVVDLGCGLGLDSLAFARAGLAVTAVEADPTVAAAARANLARWPRAEVHVGDALTTPVTADDGAFLDPARRTPGVADRHGRTRRLRRPEDLSPPFERVTEVAATARVTVAKLAPSFDPRDVPAQARAEWVSLDGDLLECALWWGAGSPGRRAVVGRGGPAGTTWHEVAGVDDPPAPLARADALASHVAEADVALAAAGLTGSLAAAVDGHELAPGTGYVSAAAPVDLPWARWYAVRDVLPLHATAVRAWLREHHPGTGPVTIKKSGVRVDPEAFRTQLRLPRRRAGGEEVILMLTTVADTPRALVVDRL